MFVKTLPFVTYKTKCLFVIGSKEPRKSECVYGDKRYTTRRNVILTEISGYSDNRDTDF